MVGRGKTDKNGKGADNDMRNSLLLLFRWQSVPLPRLHPSRGARTRNGMRSYLARAPHVALYEIHGHKPFKGEAISGQCHWDYHRYNAECWAPSMAIPTHQTAPSLRIL